VVEQAVAQPLEAQVVGVENSIYMRSNSGSDGSYTLNVSFSLGSNADINTVNVNNRVQAAISLMPTEVQQQGIQVRKQSSSILQVLFLYAEQAGQYDPLFLTNYATLNLLDEICPHPGRRLGHLFSRQNYAMRIWFDTQRLVSLNLSPSDVVTAIRTQNVQAPARAASAPCRCRTTSSADERPDPGPPLTPEEFGNIVLRANPDGSVLRVRDVARIEMGAQNQDVSTRLNGQAGVAMGIYLAPGANAVNAAAAVTPR
jgi:multidrug efflux pump subunit AcrB